MQQPLALPARYYARLTEYLAQQGVAVQPLLDDAGVDPVRLRQPEATLPQPQAERLLDGAIATCPRSDLAFDFGRSLKLSSHSMVGYAMLSSPSLDYAYRLIARYFRIIMPNFQLRYRRGPDTAEITLRAAAPMRAGFLDFHIETIAVAWYWESQELLQRNLDDVRLDLSLDEPPHAQRYAELRGARCRFAWPMPPGFRFSLPATATDLAPHLADRSALQLAEERCRALVDRVRAKGHVAPWVAMMLREAHDSFPTAQELADMMNLSRQTLHRLLRAEGASFRELAKQIRHERACRLLREGSHSISEIALELGYSDSANFSRAFQALSGLPPRKWQAGMQSTPTDTK